MERNSIEKRVEKNNDILFCLEENTLNKNKLKPIADFDRLPQRQILAIQ